MIRSWPKRPISGFVVLVMLAILSASAQSKPEVAPESTSLAGQLLVASPDIGDPRFDRTVVLMVRHNRDGAVGIVINRPVGNQSLASLMEMIGEDPGQVEGRVRLFAGGPVEPEIGFVLHSVDYHRAQTLDIGEHLALTFIREILTDIAHKRGPAKTLIAFGCASWGPGQLEDEIARHGWFTAPADPELVFDDDRAKVWQDAMARRVRQL